MMKKRKLLAVEPQAKGNRSPFVGLDKKKISVGYNMYSVSWKLLVIPEFKFGVLGSQKKVALQFVILDKTYGARWFNSEKRSF